MKPAWLAFPAALVAAPSAALAGGIFVPGAGPQAQARAGAFVARADDPTALAHNPAGFAKIDGTVVYVGSSFVDYNLTFQRAGGYEATEDADLSYEGQPFPEVENEASPDLGFAGLQAVPIIAISTDLGMPHLPLRVGVGLYAPLGYPNREFPAAHDLGDPSQPAPGPQRYDAIEQKAETAFPSIAIAYSPIPQLDIGVRFTSGFATLNATSAVWGIRNFEEYEEKDGIFNVAVDDHFVPAFGFGVLYRPIDALEIGLAYSSPVHVRAKGTGSSVLGDELGLPGMPETIEPETDPQFALCDPGGTVDNLKACVDIDLPQTVTVGARWVLRDGAGNERADLELDVSWENWGAECDLPDKVEILGKTTRACSDHLVVVDGKSGLTGFTLQPALIKHAFDDVLSFRLGGSYRAPIGGAGLTLRGGVAYDTAATDEKFTRVDMDGAARTTFGLGAGYEVSRYRIDLGLGYVLQPDRTVEACKPPDGPSVGDEGCSAGGQTPVADRESPDPIQPLQDASQQVESPFNAGEYSSSYLLFSLGFSARF